MILTAENVDNISEEIAFILSMDLIISTIFSSINDMAKDKKVEIQDQNESMFRNMLGVTKTFFHKIKVNPTHEDQDILNEISQILKPYSKANCSVRHNKREHTIMITVNHSYMPFTPLDPFFSNLVLNYVKANLGSNSGSN